MKIASITSNYTNQAQSFKGLWGRTSKNIDIDSVLGVPSHYVTYYYYPYLDETAEEIKEVVRQNSSADMIDINGQSKYIVKFCNVCTTLPFTRKDFDEYYSAQQNNNVTMSAKIHKYLEALGCRFIDNKTDQQTSAVNPVFEKSLDQGSGLDING